MMKLKILLQTFRPSFLVLTPACILLGLATAMKSQANIDFFTFSLILVGALLAHISVNTLNEYYDFKSGLDLKTERTPFSGGSGALPANPEVAPLTLIAGLVSLAFTIVIGIYFILEYGSQILPIGIIGIFIIFTYTQWLNRSPLLCLIAPGLGFGTFMVVGTNLILTGEHSQLVWLISLVPFFLTNNLLLLNQYPDIKADKSVGRNTFPIAYGIKSSNMIYSLFMLSAYGLIALLILLGHLSTLSLIALFPMLFSLAALFGAMNFSPETDIAPLHLWANVAAAILTPLLLGMTVIIS